MRILGIVVVAGLSACAHSTTTAGSSKVSAAPAVTALQEGRFTEAQEAARTILDKDGKNAQARAVQALTRYKISGEQAIFDGVGLAESAFRKNPEDLLRLRQVIVDLEASLGRVDADLTIASQDRGFAMELCPACWKVDWNHNGRLDRRDERLFQIEDDGSGQKYEDDDPRRKPTFRFDVGDLHWARAMISFQRALLDLVLVYWGKELDVNKLREGDFRLAVADAGRSREALARLQEALAQSDRSREAYLAETDDDREWVPNPRQKSHPMPLPIDDKLYQTWATLVGDARGMLEGKEGFEPAAFIKLMEPNYRRPLPQGFINVGAWLSKPSSLSLTAQELEHADKDPEKALKGIFGAAFVPSMKPSPVIDHLRRITDEVKKGEESFERKLRYLFWIN